MLIRIIFFLYLIFSLFDNVEANTKKAPLYTDEEKEMHCLALNIYFEARGETELGQFAVAAVTMNRVESQKFPNTVCKVVWQRRQFSWTHDGKSDRPRELQAWQQAKELARFVYTKYFEFQKISNRAWDITRGALNYYSPDLVNPYWAKNTKAKTQIGKHVFLSLES